MSEAVQVEPSSKKRKLPFGHFKVQVKNGSSNLGKFVLESFEDVVCKPLTQEELADGWQLVLPKSSKTQPIHHFSVTLAQLPPYLWRYYRKDFQEDGKEFFPIIKDGIYYYSVNQTKYDDVLRELFGLMNKRQPDRNEVKRLLDQLENQVSGWLVIKARNYLS